MIGRIEEIVDNSVTIKLDIDINEQPSLVNLHVVFEDGSGRNVVAEIANVNQTRMIANVVGEISDGRFTPGASSKPSFKSKVRLITMDELELLFGKQETEFGYTNFGTSNVYEGYKINVPINEFFNAHFSILGNSGAGKSSLVKALLEQDSEIELSISHTTRAPRQGEVNGREYHFISVNEFEERKARGEFLESALVHGNYYGTSRVWIEQRMAAGKDVLLEIDWQGARQVRSQFEGTVGIFILPPSIDALEARLHKRGTDSEATITRRLMGAGAEIAHAPEFEFVIINDSFDVALSQLISVVTASRLNFQNQAARHREQFISLGVPV